MAIQVEHQDGTVQWLPGGNFALPVNFQTVPEGCKIISMAPDSQIVNWTRRDKPFADKRWWA